MTTYTNDAAQSGQSNGTTATTGNTGGGTNTAFVFVSSGVTFDNTQPWDSTQDYAIPAGTGAKSYVQLQAPSGFTSTNAIRCYCYIATTLAPSSNQVWMQLGGSGINYIGINTSSHVYIGNNSSVVYTGSYTLLTATQYRIEVWYTIAAGTAVFHYALYIGDSLTPVDNYDNTGTANTGATNPQSFYIGKNTTAGNWSAMYVSMLAFNVGGTGFIGPAMQRSSGLFAVHRQAIQRASLR